MRKQSYILSMLLITGCATAEMAQGNDSTLKFKTNSIVEAQSILKSFGEQEEMVGDGRGLMVVYTKSDEREPAEVGCEGTSESGAIACSEKMLVWHGDDDNWTCESTPDGASCTRN